MTLTYDWTITIDGVNVSALVKAGGTIDYGRPTVNTGFSSPTAVFELFTEETFPNYPGAWPTVTLGDPVVIHVTWDGITQWRRFTGVIQALDWNPFGLRVTAAGTSVDWQDKTADGLDDILSPYTYDVPNELETERVDRLCDDAGLSITVEGVPARRIRGIPAGELAQPVLDWLLRIADDCDALLMEDRLGVVHYRTRNFDRPAAYTLPATVVERDSLDLAYERGTHVNAVRVFYGEPDPTTGQQAYVYANDSLTYGTVSTGERLAELYTDIQYAAGATGKATVYLEKHRLEWSVPDVVLVMNQATGAQADDILDLQENFPVTIDPLPAGCPIGDYTGDILGMTDIMHETDYRIVLHLGPAVADTGGVPEEPIFDAGSITGGTTTTYEDVNGFLWELHTWTTPGSSSVTCTSPVTADILVVGGGGGGGNTGLGVSSRAGGGGAGALYEASAEITAGSFTVTVGAGGTAAANGAASVFDTITCAGGGAGGYDSTSSHTPGAAGGSGGGGGDVEAGGTGTGGTGGNPDGFWYSDGQAGTGSVGGNGGGAAVQGTGNGQNGRESTITGTTVRYGIGGKGANNSQITYTPAANTGSGGNGGSGVGGSGTPGKDGIIALRYRIG